MNKLLTATLIGGSVIAGYGYYLSIRKTTTNLEVIPSASVHSVSLSGITIRLDLILKNPSKNGFSIKFPFIKLSFKDNSIGTSQVVDKDITVPAYGEAKVEKILVNVPIAGLFTVAGTILKSIQSKEPVVINATMLTTIKTGLIDIPFEEKHELTLKP